ncbi:MAG: diguanylate cyclase, partial [Magnetococcales bacterium]|nr:diguanylate cyclase [Magnetococcales bacterium]
MNTKGPANDLAELLNGRSFEAVLLKVLLENSREGVALVDWRGNIRRINRAFARMTHTIHEDLEGKNIIRLFPDNHDQGMLDEILEILWQDGYWSGSFAPQFPGDKQNSKLFLKVSAILPANGRVRFFLCQLSESHASDKQGDHLVKQPKDSLTQLASRPLFVDRLEQAIAAAKRHNRSLGVLILDLDRFKLINDSLGFEL